MDEEAREDYYMRQIALAEAVKSGGKGTTSSIVARAEEFYKFLKGEK